MEEREKKISDGLRYADEVKIKLEDAEKKSSKPKKPPKRHKTLAAAKEQAQDFEDKLRKDAEARAEDLIRKAREQIDLERQKMWRMLERVCKPRAGHHIKNHQPRTE